MKSHLLHAHWLLTGFLGWNLLASVCSLADRAVLARVGIECWHHGHRRGEEKTSPGPAPTPAQAHTAAGRSPQLPCAEPRSPAGKLSQGVGTALRTHITPQALLPALPGGGRGFAFAAQQPPPAFPEPAALRLFTTAERCCQVGPGSGLGCSCSGPSPPKRGLQAFASSLPSGVLPKAFKRGASLSPHPHLPEQKQGCSIQGETKTPQKPWSQALLCAQAVSSSLSVSTCACRVDTAHGPTGAHVHKEIQVCLQVHTCLPPLMDTEAHEARAFATICACRAGVRHVSLSPGTHVFVSVWKYVRTSMSELQLGPGRRECVWVYVCEGVFACAWVCV